MQGCVVLFQGKSARDRQLAVRVTILLQTCQASGWAAHKDECAIFRDVQWFVTRNWETGTNSYTFPVGKGPWYALAHH